MRRRSKGSTLEGGLMGEVSVVQIGPQMVIGLRKRGKYQDIGAMLPHLAEYAVSKGYQLQGPPVFVMHETGEEEAMKADQEGTADLEVAFPVAGKVEESGEYKYYELPGGTMAKMVHKGSYESAGAAYQKLFAWLAKNGKTVTGPIREVYLNDPREVGVDETLTEIYVPIA